MIEKIKQLMHKYREIIVYLIVGVLTTVVSWVASYVLKLFLDPNVAWQNFLLNTGSWVIAVCFAYPLNRVLVFRSKNPKIFSEFMGFAASRVSTWALEVAIMALCVNVIKMDFWIAKIFIATVLVTVLNYVISKLLVFRRKKED